MGEVYNGSESRAKRVNALIEEIINLKEKGKRRVRSEVITRVLSLVTSENLEVETCLIIQSERENTGVFILELSCPTQRKKCKENQVGTPFDPEICQENPVSHTLSVSRKRYVMSNK